MCNKSLSWSTLNRPHPVSYNVLMPLAGLELRIVTAGETAEVCGFVNSVFDRSVAVHYSKRGIDSFRKYAHPDSMSLRVTTDHFILVAEDGGGTAGMMEVRGHSHIALFFVDPERQGMGVGRALLGKALEICKGKKPNLTEITVNSSPNAVRIYRRMGFETTGNEQDIKGVRSTPMRLKL